jgi:polysaccharide export outer membrane protein
MIHNFRQGQQGGALLPKGSICLVAALAVVVTGCAKLATVEHRQGRLYAPERTPATSFDAKMLLKTASWSSGADGCSIFEDGATSKWRGGQGGRSQSIRLSRGDVVNVLVSDGDEFNGDYTVGPDGRITLPFMSPVRAEGLNEQSLGRRIEAALLRARLFTEETVRVAVRVIRYSAIAVRVSGAVFQPGIHTVNEPRGEKNEAEIVAVKSGIRKYGDTTIRRRLTAAIRVASGVRPDADISRVQLVRRGQVKIYDLRGAITGEFVDDPALEDGDEIHVPSKGCFQSELVRPSQITPRGIRIYISKMHFAADSRYDEKIPYGLRLLNAAVMASCIGGTLPTRGNREIVLVTRNHATGVTEVVQRSVEVLLRNKDRDAINPYLMPDDGVACYDSPATEAADFAGIVNTLLSPVKTYQAIVHPNSD